MNPVGAILAILLFTAVATAIVLGLIFIAVPLFKGIGWLIASFFRAIGWLIAHVFEYIGGTISDAVRSIGAVIAIVIFMPLTVLNVIVARWSAAGHFAESVKNECKVGLLCLYRIVLRRPLKLLWLHGLLEGVEQRVPAAVAAAPPRDKPSRRTGQFPGYTIVGSLPGGGSGAKLYVADPDQDKRSAYPGMPERVVIKSFALSEGSSLPQIVRESRSLECARQLGLVFEHDMDDRRFFYVMPYHAGDHLGLITRRLHAESDGNGLAPKQLRTALGYTCDLVQTLSNYHRGGLWHKDVKPENVIIHDGRAHLVDLGLITPLRSAMTLTTHGTEYFRDPEMVRQALRGVKVHQVNGVKFDVYAAGAVLYFTIENDFPPHGALSRFTRRSPEALKWIIRRAMAEYTHRYDTADDMLADLRFVMESADPYNVKPAMLPSMRGGDVADFESEHEPETFEVAHAAKAGSPRPPHDGIGDHDRPPAEPVEPAVAAAAPAETIPERRPRLEVTNWWTGAYRVQDPGSATAAVGGPHERQAYAGYRHDVGDLRHQVRHGALTARKAAREQVKAARRRAHDMRRRAHSHRHRSTAERQPSAALILVSLLFIAMVIAAAVPVGLLFTASRAEQAQRARAENAAAARIDGVIDRGRPLLLVPSVSDRNDPKIMARIDEIIAEYERGGYDVIVDHALVDDGMRDLIERWNETHDPAIDRKLEDALEANDLYGILHVTEQLGGGPVDERINGKVVWSERPGAEHRRYAHGPAMNIDGPLLLLNDHPTWHDPAIKREVEREVWRLERGGNEVIIDDEREVLVRKAMPSGSFDPEEPLPDMLVRVLEESSLGGVVWVYAEPGDGDPKDRLSIRILAPKHHDSSSEEAQAPELPPSAPRPPVLESPEEFDDPEKHSLRARPLRLAA
jgi:hypothetical protein